MAISKRKKQAQKDKSVFSASIHSNNVPDLPSESNSKNRFDHRDFHLFGTDNLFPQAVASLNRKSPVHAGIINYKTVYTLGKGFQVDESNKALIDLVAKSNGSNRAKWHLTGISRDAVRS